MPIPTLRTLALALAGASILFVGLLGGCGPSGPPRYDLSGKVTYNIQPVPAGRVILEPDRAAGNTGPRAVANIKDGHYSTPPGEGTVGGPHRVMIYGGDGKPVGGTPYGNSLFPLYETTANLPQETAQQDFTVPAQR
ncbi:MAG: hypothetical protein NTW96_20885 [Planctomycetia bacterium]|nr:hypothetical protein [Planctomycetia bacterium]